VQTIIGWLNNRDDRQTRVFGRMAPSCGPARRPPPCRRWARPRGDAPQPDYDQRSEHHRHLVPNDQIRLYGNMMSVTDPGPSYSARDGNGLPLTAPTYTNHEVGLRLDEFGNKLLFDVSPSGSTSKTTRSALARRSTIK